MASKMPGKRFVPRRQPDVVRGARIFGVTTTDEIQAAVRIGKARYGDDSMKDLIDSARPDVEGAIEVGAILDLELDGRPDP